MTDGHASYPLVRVLSKDIKPTVVDHSPSFTNEDSKTSNAAKGDHSLLYRVLRGQFDSATSKGGIEHEDRPGQVLW